jgi:hypothetical protein
MSLKVRRRPESGSRDDGSLEDCGQSTPLGLEPGRRTGPIAAVARRTAFPLEFMPSLIGRSAQ